MEKRTVYHGSSQIVEVKNSHIRKYDRRMVGFYSSLPHREGA